MTYHCRLDAHYLRRFTWDALSGTPHFFGV
jgi:hypothetical protein